MPNIDTYLNSIMIAELGEDVRGSIHDAIEIMNEAVDEGITEAAAMVGTPLVASTAAGMTDTTKVYVYTGDEFGYNYGYWYYYDGSTWQEGGAYNSEGGIDSINEKIGDLSELITVAKTDLVSAINEAALSGGGSGLTNEEKSLILTMFSKAAYADDDASEAYEELSSLWASYSVTWSGSGFAHSNNATSIENGQTFISTVTASTGFTISTVTVTMGGNTVQGAWSNGMVNIPNVTGNIVITVATVQATVSSISAIYTQSGMVYDVDTLDSLKNDLVVTATYVDSSSYVVPSSEYTLSGTLTEGTSVVTVSYVGKTTTFSVTVTHSEVPSGYTQYDYLQLASSGTGTGNTMVNTPAQLSSDHTVIAKIKITSSAGATTPILGTRASNDTKEFALWSRMGNTLGYWIAGTDSSTSISFSYGTVHTVTVKPVGSSSTYPNNVVINVDGTDYNSQSTSTGRNYPSWFGLLGYARSSSETTGEKCSSNTQLGKVTVLDKNNNNLYCFVPAKNSEGKYGFYENVNHQFYYNSQGSTTLVSGGYWE